MGKAKKKKGDRTVYQEFGTADDALERPVKELSPQEHDLRIQASRKGRGGKTVTVITGFQLKPETLKKLLKTLKAQCGTGGTVKENTLEIQGEHREKLQAALTRLGYRAKLSGG